jgi:putative two-component system response regulator
VAIEKATILVVDDTPENIDLLAGILKGEYHVKAAKNGELALKIARLTPAPELILLDIMMPDIDGFEVCKRLKQDPTTRHIPVIFVTAKISPEDEIRGFSLGAVDYITKPISPPIVKARVRTHLALFNQSRELYYKVKEQTATINETRQKIIERLGRAAEYKDNETGMHVVRMSHYSHILALAAGMNEADADLLKAAAPMHDIGKIGIPDNILQKPGKLDEAEWKIMQSHVEIGADILGDDDSELLKMAKLVALSHHEKWDGSGYPNGLAGEAIPLEGRIVAIADVFDALTAQRPYKRAWSVTEAVEMMQELSGQHFDPQLLALFVNELPKILEIKAVFSD